MDHLVGLQTISGTAPAGWRLRQAGRVTGVMGSEMRWASGNVYSVRTTHKVIRQSLPCSRFLVAGMSLDSVQYCGCGLFNAPERSRSSLYLHMRQELLFVLMINLFERTVAW